MEEVVPNGMDVAIKDGCEDVLRLAWSRGGGRRRLRHGPLVIVFWMRRHGEGGCTRAMTCVR